MNIVNWDSASSGEFSELALWNVLQNLGYQVVRYVYPIDAHFPEHNYDVDKIDAVISGQFKFTIGQNSIVLTAGDYVLVPKKIVHSAEIVGNDVVVSLDATKKD